MLCLNFACFSGGSLLGDDHLTPTLESRLVKGGMGKWKRDRSRERKKRVEESEREGRREGEKDWEGRWSCVVLESRYLECRSIEVLNLLWDFGKEMHTPTDLCLSSLICEISSRIRWPEILTRASRHIQCLKCSLEFLLILHIYSLTKTIKPLLIRLT